MNETWTIAADDLGICLSGWLSVTRPGCTKTAKQVDALFRVGTL